LTKTALLYDSQKEEEQHLNNIHSIAEEIKIQEEDVKLFYEIILKRYKDFAKIKLYLPILVKKEVKEVFMKRKKSKSFYGITNPFRSEK